MFDRRKHLCLSNKQRNNNGNSKKTISLTVTAILKDARSVS